MEATGAIGAGLANIVRKMKGREILMIPVCMVLLGWGPVLPEILKNFLPSFLSSLALRLPWDLTP